MNQLNQGSAPKEQKPQPVYMVEINIDGKKVTMVGPADNQSQAVSKAVKPLVRVKTLTPWEVASWAAEGKPIGFKLPATKAQEEPEESDLITSCENSGLLQRADGEIVGRRSIGDKRLGGLPAGDR